MKGKTFAEIMVCGLLLTLPVVTGAQETEGEARQLEDIAVTGTRIEKRLKDSPVITEVIGADEIENSSAATVTEILEDYGIMYTGNAMGDYVQLQGMGENRILYLIDGRRLVGRISSRLKGETLPLGNVERIEIVRGPQSALYGSDGIGGVINIITKKPGDSVSVSASLSNSFLLAYDDPDTEWKPGNPFEKVDPVREQNLQANVGFPLLQTRNIISLEGGRAAYYYGEQEAVSVLPAYLRGKAGFDTTAALGGGAELRVGGSFLAMRSDERLNSRGSLTRLDYIRADGHAEFEWSPLDAAMLNVRLYDNFYQRDKDTYSGITKEWTSQGKNHEHENLTSLEIFGSYEGFDHFLLSAGMEGAFNFMDKYNLKNDGDSFAAIDRESIFFQAEYFKEDRYSLIGGLRGERNSQFGVTAAPKFSGMYYIVPELRILAGLGTGYRAPDFSDLYLVKDDNPNHPLVKGNSDLKPEYAISSNLGFEFAKEKVFFFQMNAYYSELFNEIANIDQGYQERGMTVYLAKNIARSFRAGIDSEGRLDFLRYAYASAGYSWLFAWDRSEGEELRLQPAHTVRMKLGWDWKGINAYIRGRYFSPLDPDDPEYTHRFTLDLYAGFTIQEHFKIQFSVDNITGTIDNLGPVTPQAFTLGFKYFL
jgi:outer membrane receptor for ferrienterochelin and colicins